MAKEPKKLDEDGGGNSSGSQRRQPARLAWLERLGADPKPPLVLLAPRRQTVLDARSGFA